MNFKPDEILELLREILAELQEIHALLEEDYDVVPFPEEDDVCANVAWWKGDEV